MDKPRLLAVLVLCVLFTAPAVTLDFKIDVDEVTDAVVIEPQYINSTSTYQNFNVTVENQGSVGCTYRLKADVKQGKTEFTRYSRGIAMWPGDSKLLDLKFLPLEYNGTVETNVSVVYCGYEQHVDYFEFNFTESKSPESKVQAETLAANNTNAVVELPVGNGTLIPQETYPEWRVGSAEIKNGRAFVEYEAPIFRRTDNITYTVLNSDGDIIGKTEVTMVEPQPSLLEQLKEQIPIIFGSLLLVSLLGNLYLGRRRFVPEPIRVATANMWVSIKEAVEEFGDRDIKK